ncbi:hypothetical protein B0O99DRAFT_695235 [Bisporella sp. PMI_857]|nr:hypothetical protein B0O99DRAFT_695235 [Bisporella sp. PMI_857]
MSAEHGYMDNEPLEDEQDISFEADQDLQYQRAQVDHKLKSAFESIFEKYGRNFDGIGDEIDLRTGEILVNNGHLIQMQDERDAGDATSQSMLDATLDDSDDSVIMLDNLEDEDEEGDEGGGDMVGPEEEGGSGDDGSDEVEDSLSDEDMMEDDMILRGFAQASQFIKQEQSSDVVDSINNAHDILRSPRQMGGFDSHLQGSALPSRSQILSQFGPQFGPQIADFVKQRGTLNDDSIESAWRAPPLPQSAYKKPAKTRPIKPLTVTERSPSPKKSVWATEQEPRLRSNFTRADDELLLDFVAKVKELSLEFFAASTWRILERAHPHHSYTVWRRYFRNQLMNRDLQRVNSHVSIFTLPTLNGTRSEEHSFGNKDAHESCNLPNQVGQIALSERQRSTRERKPRNCDSTLLDWSEAVSAIETLDPALHSSILDDMKSTTADRTSSPSQVLQLDPNCSQGSALKNVDYGTPRSRSPAPSEKPCPYKDCVGGPTMSYRVLRSEDEELSPFCLHLLHIHQTTPFPCKEAGCERKGARGFFIETNLLKHVWSAHPYPEALHRFQAREEFSLQDKLRPMIARSQPSNSIASQALSTPVPQRRHMEFSAPSKSTEKATLPFVKSVESTSISVDITRTPESTISRFSVKLAGERLFAILAGFTVTHLYAKVASSSKRPSKDVTTATFKYPFSIEGSSEGTAWNIVDPSYEFSDEEDVGTSAINTSAIARVITPYAQSLDMLERYIMKGQTQLCLRRYRLGN